MYDRVLTIDADGASLAVPGPAPEQQKSRSRSYRRAYHRACYATVSACLPRPVKEAFRDACGRLGVTQHAMLAAWVTDWLDEKGLLPSIKSTATVEKQPPAASHTCSVAVIGQ